MTETYNSDQRDKLIMLNQRITFLQDDLINAIHDHDEIQSEYYASCKRRAIEMSIRDLISCATLVTHSLERNNK